MRLCAHAPESARPEPRVEVLRVCAMADGERSVVAESCTVAEMAGRVEAVLRSVRVGLSGGEYAAMALAVAQMLATDTEEAPRA